MRALVSIQRKSASSTAAAAKQAKGLTGGPACLRCRSRSRRRRASATSSRSRRRRRRDARAAAWRRAVREGGARQSAKTTTPTGRLTRKIQCQLSTSVRTPPSSTPMLPPPAATKPKTPIAFARSAGSVNRVMISESATAETTAPPRPCTARAPTRKACELARPQASEAAVKSAIPIRKSRRCPKRSPSRPPSSRKPPKVSRYAFTTQASEVSEKPRSARIDGRATFTIVVSRTIIRSPRQRTISASQRVRLSVMVMGEFLSVFEIVSRA